jgi:hypothetical protein
MGAIGLSVQCITSVLKSSIFLNKGSNTSVQACSIVVPFFGKNQLGRRGYMRITTLDGEHMNKEQILL